MDAYAICAFTEDCTRAIPDATILVSNPRTPMSIRTESWCSQNGAVLNKRNTPIWTGSDPWKMAVDGVGPSIALGSHDENGSCADLAEAESRIISEMKTPTSVWLSS